MLHFRRARRPNTKSGSWIQYIRGLLILSGSRTGTDFSGPDDFEKPDFKSDDFMIIELKLFPGRTAEQKKDLIEKITDNLNQSLKIALSDVFIVIEEPSLENWGMGGKQKC